MAYQSSIRSYVRKGRGTQTRPMRKPSYTRRSVFQKTVRSGRTAVASLQNQITRLRRTVANVKEVVQYKDTAVDTIGNAFGDNCYIRPLMKFSYWNRIFGTEAEDELPNDCRILKTNLDCLIETGTERNAIDYTMYVVTLTKFAQAELLNPSTGLLNSPLAIDVHYSRRDNTQVNAGFAFLNRKYFNILKVKRIVTGVTDGNSTETASLRKRFYMKFTWNKGKGFIHKNPSGSWKAKPCPQYATANAFVLLFNNDSTSDTQDVKFLMNGIHTVEV